MLTTPASPPFAPEMACQARGFALTMGPGADLEGEILATHDTTTPEEGFTSIYDCTRRASSWRRPRRRRRRS